MTAIIPDFIQALNHELIERKEYLSGEIIETIYIGGGTPTLLITDQIELLIKNIRSHYQLKENAEITIEANPEDLHSEFLHDLSLTSVNRLSIGIQSLNDGNLIFLNRRHNSERAMQCLIDARKHGFENISIDLIYGIPGMNNMEWQSTLDRLPDVEHISAYHLTIEPGTSLYRKVATGLLKIQSEDISAQQFLILHEFAKKRKMIHYEISNLAKEGYFSKHNTAYWQRKKYLGVGPSAHSYNGTSRQWNIRNVKKYIELADKGEPYFEREDLTEKDHFNEYLMVSLRTIWGADEGILLNEFGNSFYSRMQSEIKPFIKTGHVIYEKGTYKMTPSGWLISDHILTRLISD